MNAQLKQAGFAPIVIGPREPAPAAETTTEHDRSQLSEPPGAQARAIALGNEPEEQSSCRIDLLPAHLLARVRCETYL